MLGNFLRKKEELTYIQKNMLKIFCMFYEQNKGLFIDSINNQKEKKKIIKKIYELLNYTNCPILNDNQEVFENSNLKIYRGISADNQDLLHEYINNYLNGEPFYGGRASIYGTGIYTVLGENISVASEYASDGGVNTCGAVIESIMDKETKIIESSKANDIRNILFDKLRKLYHEDIENYLSILEDDGALCSILGYDAIYVEEKKYMVVLNRGKMIVNSNILNSEYKKEENYPKR